VETTEAQGNGSICTFNVAQGGDIADTLMVDYLKERLFIH
jgi:hypothetical protein